MQLVILVYHYTGASQSLRVSIVVRLLVASYLSLTGYGHTVFFLTKTDYSFRRVAAVLVRLNLLSCILPYAMQTDYMDYYFAPLVSFWFLFIYFTMRLWSGMNSHLPSVITKVTLSHLLCWLVHYDGRLAEVVLRSLTRTCKIVWDVEEWHFRVAVDIRMMYAGMLTALLRTGIAAEHQPVHSVTTVASGPRWRIWTSAALSMAAVFVLPTYWHFAQQTGSKYDYNWWHTKSAWLPVISYVLLRNLNALFRSFHSTMFAWFGRCSLETFTLQFHIWLAADTKALLSVGIWRHIGLAKYERCLDFHVLTPIFLWLSDLTSDATNCVTGWITQSSTGEKSLADAGIGEDRKKSSELKLPDHADSLPGYMSGQFSRSSKLIVSWSRDLKVNIVLILVTLWVLNLVQSAFWFLASTKTDSPADVYVKNVDSPRMLALREASMFGQMSFVCFSCYQSRRKCRLGGSFVRL